MGKSWNAFRAQINKLVNVHFNTTTDFGEFEQSLQDKIDLNRAMVRVAADLSGDDLDEIKAEKSLEEPMAENTPIQTKIDALALLVDF